MRQKILKSIGFNYVYNKEKFLKNNLKLIIVCGLAGSGKTTICNKLSKLYHIKAIHLDDLRTYAEKYSLRELRSKNRIFYNFFKRNLKIFRSVKKVTYGYVYDIMYFEFMKYVFEYSRYSPNMIIIEGVKAIRPFLDSREPEFFNEKLPLSLLKENALLVILRTPKIIASIRGAFRNIKLFRKHDSIIKDWIFQFKRLFFFKETQNNIKKIKKLLK